MSRLRGLLRRTVTFLSLRCSWRDEEGQTLSDYVLLAAIVAFACLAAATFGHHGAGPVVP